MRRFALLLASTLALGMVAGPGASQAAEILFMSGPGGASGTNYTVPVLVMAQGDSVTYANFDLGLHDVRSTQEQQEPLASWCTEFPFNFPVDCPLFTSRLIGAAQMAPVLGVEELAPGNYPFVCSIHDWMQGTLIVV